MTALRPPLNHPWGAYLQRFHADRPGITERVLGRCHAGGIDPYQWCAQPLADQPGPILDLACGSGPMADRIHGWIGVDTSAAELGAARDRQRGPVMRASATRLPIRACTVDAAACSMGMQIIDPVAEALTELARVLRPGGRAALLLPAGRPVPWRHAVTYGRLQVALRQRIRYPNDHVLRPAALRQAATAVGLQVSDDERLAFTLPLDTAAEADELLTSLYLPGIDPARLDAGRRVLEGSVGSTLTVPLRRILLERTEASG